MKNTVTTPQELETLINRVLVAEKTCGVSEKEFLAKLDELSCRAFDDQCTGANPPYPLIAEIKELYVKAYNGEI